MKSWTVGFAVLVGVGKVEGENLVVNGDPMDALSKGECSPPFAWMGGFP